MDQTFLRSFENTPSRFKLGYNDMKQTERFVSLSTSVVLTEAYSDTVKSEELIGTTEYLTQQARWRINRCRYTGFGCILPHLVVMSGVKK